MTRIILKKERHVYIATIYNHGYNFGILLLLPVYFPITALSCFKISN